MTSCVYKWRELFPRVLPYVDAEWRTVTEISQRSGLSTRLVAYTMIGAERFGLVDFRFHKCPAKTKSSRLQPLYRRLHSDVVVNHDPA
jgi:hypothetical protein